MWCIEAKRPISQPSPDPGWLETSLYRHLRPEPTSKGSLPRPWLAEDQPFIIAICPRADIEGFCFLTLAGPRRAFHYRHLRPEPTSKGSSPDPGWLMTGLLILPSAREPTSKGFVSGPRLAQDEPASPSAPRADIEELCSQTLPG